MSIYTTPLQFGYFLSLLFFVLFLIRGYRQERLSDKLFAWVMFILSQEMQDYTFGFSGINFLWNELNGFPRGIYLLFGPAVYFYMRSQVSRSFQLKWTHAWHLLPWGAHFIFGLIIFLQGPFFVQKYQSGLVSELMGYENLIVRWASYFYYFRLSLILYNRYRKWTVSQFSDTELISFSWFKIFLYGMIVIVISKETMGVLDWFFDWEFYQDWWWNLVIVVVAIYVGFAGYQQAQPRNIDFQPYPETTEKKEEGNPEDEWSKISEKLERLMNEERLFLEPELSLSSLSKHLNTTPTLLSATINQLYKRNFNDYINGLRVEAFKKAYRDPSNKKYTMLSIAYDCGFNSKATFNRAFKKMTHQSPKEYFK